MVLNLRNPRSSNATLSSLLKNISRDEIEPRKISKQHSKILENSRSLSKKEKVSFSASSSSSSLSGQDTGDILKNQISFSSSESNSSPRISKASDDSQDISEGSNSSAKRDAKKRRDSVKDFADKNKNHEEDKIKSLDIGKKSKEQSFSSDDGENSVIAEKTSDINAPSGRLTNKRVSYSAETSKYKPENLKMKSGNESESLEERSSKGSGLTTANHVYNDRTLTGKKDYQRYDGKMSDQKMVESIDFSDDSISGYGSNPKATRRGLGDTKYLESPSRKNSVNTMAIIDNSFSKPDRKSSLKIDSSNKSRSVTTEDSKDSKGGRRDLPGIKNKVTIMETIHDHEKNRLPTPNLSSIQKGNSVKSQIDNNKLSDSQMNVIVEKHPIYRAKSVNVADINKGSYKDSSDLDKYVNGMVTEEYSSTKNEMKMLREEFMSFKNETRDSIRQLSHVMDKFSSIEPKTRDSLSTDRFGRKASNQTQTDALIQRIENLEKICYELTRTIKDNNKYGSPKDFNDSGLVDERTDKTLGSNRSLTQYDEGFDEGLREHRATDGLNYKYTSSRDRSPSYLQDMSNIDLDFQNNMCEKENRNDFLDDNSLLLLYSPEFIYDPIMDGISQKIKSIQNRFHKEALMLSQTLKDSLNRDSDKLTRLRYMETFDKADKFASFDLDSMLDSQSESSSIEYYYPKIRREKAGSGNCSERKKRGYQSNIENRFPSSLKNEYSKFCPQLHLGPKNELIIQNSEII
ncbi:unnamed protein product [Gordionus sp. m RMFG-2023]